MASLWVDLRDIKFQLFEVLKIGKHYWARAVMWIMISILATW